MENPDEFTAVKNLANKLSFEDIESDLSVFDKIQLLVGTGPLIENIQRFEDSDSLYQYTPSKQMIVFIAFLKKKIYR